MNEQAPPPSQPDDQGRDYDLTGIAQRLKELNPGLTNIKVEPPGRPGAAVRVVIETTRAELAAVQGQLHLTDPELAGVQIETALKFLDQKPGEKIKVGLRRNPANPAGPGGSKPGRLGPPVSQRKTPPRKPPASSR
jgi:hypothetical protein